MSRRARPFMEFTDKDGRAAGRAPVSETHGLNNKHFKGGRRKVLCPQPGCGELFAPVCPNPDCAGNRVPRAMMRLERMDRGTTGPFVDKLRREVRQLPAPKVERKPAPASDRQRRPAAGSDRRPRIKVASESHAQKLQAKFEKRRAA